MDEQSENSSVYRGLRKYAIRMEIMDIMMAKPLQCGRYCSLIRDFEYAKRPLCRKNSSSSVPKTNPEEEENRKNCLALLAGIHDPGYNSTYHGGHDS
jgi:hypothetical protein